MAIEPHVAVVLAAGGSRRLGRPKQLLRRDGEVLIRRAARIAGATQPMRLLIVVGAHASEMRAALTGIDATIIDNTDWPIGLASSLQLVAQALSTHRGATLLVGCDQPALELAHLQYLLRAGANAGSGCAATAHQRLPGIPAVVSSAILIGAQQLSGDRGLGVLLRALPQGAVALLDAPELWRDIDDAADLEAAMASGLIDR